MVAVLRANQNRTQAAQVARITPAPTKRVKHRPSGFKSRSVIRVYDATGNVIETHEYAGEFKEW